jgi:hypothetical protein
MIITRKRGSLLKKQRRDFIVHVQSKERILDPIYYDLREKLIFRIDASQKKLECFKEDKLIEQSVKPLVLKSNRACCFWSSSTPQREVSTLKLSESAIATQTLELQELLLQQVKTLHRVFEILKIDEIIDCDDTLSLTKLKKLINQISDIIKDAYHKYLGIVHLANFADLVTKIHENKTTIQDLKRQWRHLDLNKSINSITSKLPNPTPKMLCTSVSTALGLVLSGLGFALFLMTVSNSSLMFGRRFFFNKTKQAMIKTEIQKRQGLIEGFLQRNCESETKKLEELVVQLQDGQNQFIGAFNHYLPDLSVPIVFKNIICRNEQSVLSEHSKEFTSFSSSGSSGSSDSSVSESLQKGDKKRNSGSHSSLSSTVAFFNDEFSFDDEKTECECPRCTDCPICLESLEFELLPQHPVVHFAECGSKHHYLHSHCYTNWAKQNKQCLQCTKTLGTPIITIFIYE